MPTREYTQIEAKEAIIAGEKLKEKCKHSRLAGECLLFSEMCYYEKQEECPEFC